MNIEPSDVPLPIPGVRLATAAAGIRYRDRDDLVLMELAGNGTCAAVFTRNAFSAAPVQLARAHLRQAMPRYLLINAGNANAGTGRRGLDAACACCEGVARAAGCETVQVLPFSTGVIGEHLPVEPIAAQLPGLVEALSGDAWPAAARAIMTTDTRPKLAARTFQVDGHPVRLTGMAKGAGMIRPDMATLLVFLATDLSATHEVLQAVLAGAVAPSFNSITVDGDTSTNDACVLLASGANPLPPLMDPASPTALALQAAVTDLCMELAAGIVADAEGATKQVAVEVSGALDEAEACRVAYTVAESPLVKTALFAADPNWGRILAAVGRAGVRDLDIQGVRIWLDRVLVVADGGRAPGYREGDGRSVMAQREFAIRVALGRGEAEARILTCDLSCDYVRINAEYRT